MLEPHGGWSAAPQAGPPDGILLLEMFGRLTAAPDAPFRGEGALWSVFRTRAEMMGWERGSSRPGALSSTHEAELTAGSETARLGWAQVGIEEGSSLVRVLPALIQCLEDALGRFGIVESSALQLTAVGMSPAPSRSDATHASWLPWFSAHDHDAAVDAALAFNGEMLRGRAELDILARLGRSGTPFFSFGPSATVPAEFRIVAPPEAPLDRPLSAASRGIAVRMPEWSNAAAAWVLSAAVDATRASASTTAFACRLSRPA
ncbi:MAG: hypothetical protein AB7L91_00420 [Dehalococcoidia bacterium]